MLDTLTILENVSKEFGLDQGQEIRLANISEQLDMSYVFSEEETHESDAKNEIILAYREPILKMFAKMLKDSPEIDYQSIDGKIKEIDDFAKNSVEKVLKDLKDTMYNEGWSKRVDFEKSVENNAKLPISV